MSERKPSALDRTLNIFAEVKAGEGASALLMLFGIFLVLTAYYVLKPVRDALIIVENGAAVKSYASAGLAVLSIGLVALYNWLYDRSTDRARLVRQIFLGFAAVLLVFAGIEAVGSGKNAAIPIAIPFFFYAGLFGAFVIAVFWSFGNDLYDREQGERLFPFIANGQTMGAAVGAGVVAVYGAKVDTWLLMVLATILLLAAMVVILQAAKMVGASKKSAADGASVAKAKPTSFLKLASDRYILLLALLILMLNWVNSNGEYLIDRLLEEEAAAAAAAAGHMTEADIAAFSKKFMTQWKGAFFGLVNVVGMLTQAFIVSRFIKYLGVGVAVIALPAIAFFGSLTLAIVPTLFVIRLTKTAENATDYSLQNTAQQSLWLVTSPEAKYKAKAAIDTFVKRAGDLLSAGTVALGSTLAMGTRDFVLVNIGLAAIWIVVAVALAREYKRRKHALDAPSMGEVAS